MNVNVNIRYLWLAGDDTPGEDNPFLTVSDHDRSCDGKNMALFEVQFN